MKLDLYKLKFIFLLLFIYIGRQFYIDYSLPMPAHPLLINKRDRGWGLAI